MKLSKHEVGYEHPAAKPQNHCGVCRHFEPPDQCEIVAGRIRPEDWCRRFEREQVMAQGWVNLAFDDEEMADHALPAMPQPPQYPYGLKIALTGRELEMCELSLPSRGDLLDFRAMAEVTAVTDDGQQRVEMQIILIKCVENEDTEDEDGGEDDE